MNFKTRKSLISILCAYVICLIASTATIVIFVEESFFKEPYWGNLRAGDEMFETDVGTHVDGCTLRGIVGGK